jgi:hypothetical protein
MPVRGRTGHYFARGEYTIALLLDWLGVQDVREQLPLWPTPHEHPLKGAPGTQGLQLPWVRGLAQIAAEAGIRHGVEPGTSVPHIATLDLMVTDEGPSGLRLCGFACKPEPKGEELPWRVREHLELQRLYCRELSSTFLLVASTLVPLVFAGQLESWSCAFAIPTVLAERREDFAGLVAEAKDASLTEAVNNAAYRLSLTSPDSALLYRHCAWHQLIDIDPAQPILPSRPIPLGGRARRAELRRNLLGSAA